MAVWGGLSGGVAFLFPPFAGGFEFAVAGGEDLLLPSLELVLGGDVAEGTVQADGVVVFHKAGHDALGVLQGQRRTRADAVLLEDTMPAFDLAVALRVVGRGLHVA